MCQNYELYPASPPPRLFGSNRTLPLASFGGHSLQDRLHSGVILEQIPSDLNRNGGGADQRRKFIPFPPWIMLFSKQKYPTSLGYHQDCPRQPGTYLAYLLNKTKNKNQDLTDNETQGLPLGCGRKQKRAVSSGTGAQSNSCWVRTLSESTYMPTNQLFSREALTASFHGVKISMMACFQLPSITQGPML